jgi:hypothetical protein
VKQVNKIRIASARHKPLTSTQYPHTFGLMTSRDRRKIIIERMEELATKGSDCRNCAGNCCTYEANSMMVTPLEATEIMDHMSGNQLISDEFKDRLLETVKKYRLDRSVGNGKKSFLRRTYTCPFFNHQELGCPLPKEIKPYGCLAFNNHHHELKASEHCYSETELLERRDELFAEEAVINESIVKKKNLYWHKAPLPLALLDIWPALKNADQQSH